MSRLSFNVQDDIATDRRIKLEPGLDNLIEFEALLGGGPPPLPPDQAPRQPPLPAEFAMLGLKGASLAYVLGDCETPEFLDVMITISGRPGVVFHWIADRVYKAELRKAASTASVLAERLEIPQEHSSLETTHNLYGFWKFAFPGTEHINIKS